MEELRDWSELSQKEQQDFANKITRQGIIGWDALKQAAVEAGIEPDEDILPTVYELNHWK